jgi:hypothetical protein
VSRRTQFSIGVGSDTSDTEMPSWIGSCGPANPAVAAYWDTMLPMSTLALRVARTASGLRGFQRDPVDGVIERCQVSSSR